jgi:hypothetical protein
MKFNYYHEFSEIYCNICGNDQFDPCNDNYCELCMDDTSMHFTCELCLDTYCLDNNIDICPKYYQSQYILYKFFKKILLKKRLILYSELLLDQYYNPKSKYIEYLVSNFDNEHSNNFKEIGYIDKYNNLKLLIFK